MFLDTCALLNLQENVFSEHFIISQKTLEEIENIKTSASKDPEVKYKARKIARLLDEYTGKYSVIKTDAAVMKVLTNMKLQETPDNIILSAAKRWSEITNQKILLVSDDINVKFMAREVFKFEVRGSEQLNIITDAEEYTGFKEVTFSDAEMSYFYTNLNDNKYGCINNEYLIIKKSDGEIVDYRRWNKESFVPISYENINSYFLGKIRPRNPQQILACDMIQNTNKTIKVLAGGYGTGKDFLMIANAIKQIEEGKFDRLIFVRNVIGVKNAEEIGYLPGTKDEKLRPFAMILADHLGGESGLDSKIAQGEVEIEHLGYIRGRDIRNSIIYCSEAENLTKEHVQLLIGRVGEGSELWMNGDFKQTDSPLLKVNNGLVATISKLADHEKFGYVKLIKTERSETAAMADLLD